jgi:hypothetical protein
MYPFRLAVFLYFSRMLCLAASPGWHPRLAFSRCKHPQLCVFPVTKLLLQTSHSVPHSQRTFQGTPFVLAGLPVSPTTTSLPNLRPSKFLRLFSRVLSLCQHPQLCERPCNRFPIRTLRSLPQSHLTIAYARVKAFGGSPTTVKRPNFWFNFTVNYLSIQN